MTINADHIPDRMTHEEAADLFMSTMLGRSTGVNREQILTLLRARFKTEDELSEYIQQAKAHLAARLEPLVPTGRFAGRYSINRDPVAPSITCHTCGMTSHHPDDISHLWCGKCNKYHES